MRSSVLFSMILFLGIFQNTLLAAHSSPTQISRLFNTYSIICSDSHVIEHIDRKVLITSGVWREKIYHINVDRFEVSFDSKIIYQILDFMQLLVPQENLPRHTLVNMISKQVKNKFPDSDDITDLLEVTYFLDIPILTEGFSKSLELPSKEPVPAPKLGSQKISLQEEFTLVCEGGQKITGISYKVMRESRSFLTLIEDLGEEVNIKRYREIPLCCDMKDMKKILKFMKILADPSEFIENYSFYNKKTYIDQEEFESHFINYVQRNFSLADINRLYKLVYFLDIYLLEKAFNFLQNQSARQSVVFCRRACFVNARS